MDGGSRARRLTTRLAAQGAASRRGVVARRIRFRDGGEGGNGDAFGTRSPLGWLNAAGTRIGTTLDLERTAQELAEFAVPRLADGAAVDLLESVLRGGEGERGRGADTPVTRAMAVHAIDRLTELEPSPVGELVQQTQRNETLLTVQCLRGRKPVLVSRMRDEDYARVAPTPSAAAKMRQKGVHSYMAVPLVARGVLLGSADFVRAGSSPPFTPTDVALAEQLASKAAVSIDNARLYGREREHVVSLQRSLLPRATPNTPGLHVRVDYAPAFDAHGVGGDWYDVVSLPSGRTALVVGDVMGHGLPAAATMGRLRTVARTLMTLDIAPERVLARLDLATRDLEDDQVATCLCAVYDPADAGYTLASAGHPPPLLVDVDGTPAYVDVPVGAPLGTGVIPYDPLRLEGPAGSRLVLYTDGLVKNRVDDVDVQLRRLRETTAGLSGRRLDEGGLLAAVPGGAGRFDEAVLLIASGCKPSADVQLRVWDLPAGGTAASTARRLVREQLGLWGLAELADVTELVVSELVGNALRYGQGPGELRMLRNERLMVEVSDTGPDLPQIQHADVSDEGGRGLQLVNMLCRRWGSCRTPRGKVVWAEQNIPE
ncbi:SpoIIE family protein phosphatase [Streptomyces sp. JJ36]|uniref:ATP-binding SpoIIE family protein phosphatase n=1 Tax=Streptomyces sp. JJ36 TaxID=2736645 RepID=UPI001F01DDB8|nr:SpoIIE family protein phosphatase [Streptomyces sp. JJ36]MCF6524981.1 SpoIIE family protein phosphatase [Streptomyces sp. JJ36]